MRHSAVLLVLLLASPIHAAERRPNFLILYADDLGWGDVGFNGRTEWRTPNLDRLARQGTQFSRWYTAGVVCAPSRAALMTGKYTIHNGVSGNNADLPIGEITVAAALRKEGYKTALFGKWHHGQPRTGQASYRHPLDLGFDTFFGFTDAVHAWQHFPKELWEGRELKAVTGYTATQFSDRAIGFLKENKDKPFFLYLAYTEPHLNIEAPAEDIREYQGKFTEADPAKPVNATYAAMIVRLDKEVGRVLQTLDEQGLAENTVVVFSSDHGATFEAGNLGTAAFHDSNRPFRGQKRTVWEGGIRVPGVVRWPGHVPAGEVSPEVVHMTDVFPTFMAIAGVNSKSGYKVDGQNLVEVWEGKKKGPERTLFWEWRSEGSHQLAAMRGDLKLVVTDDQPPELFDVVRDPAERRSLHAQYPMLVKELRRELAEWIATETPASKEGRGPTGR